jgi:DNA-binding PadR family transcriptional regulator
MNTVAENTLPEKLLLAASHLEEAGQTPFSAEALVVSAWQKYPRTFGLKGYEDKYPDSNRVLAQIMGEKGLPNRGWMVKVGQKLYALTRDGRQVVRKLLQGEEVPPLTAKRALPTDRLPKEIDILLQSLLCASVVMKWRQGRQDDWTFSEACRFWSLGESTGSKVDLRLDEIQSQLVQAEKILNASGPQPLGNGVEVTATQAGQLADLHHQLEQRFSRHLNLLRSRASYG